MQKGSGQIVLILVLALIFLGSGFWYFSQEDRDDGFDIGSDSFLEEESEGADLAQGELEDVTEGEDVRGVNTNGEASGVVSTSYREGRFELEAVFENLPDPIGSDFYEGWVVRRGVSFSVVSTGRVEKENNVYVNSFTAEEDLRDHDFYVLTLEPDDGDPAPADHILDGELR